MSAGEIHEGPLVSVAVADAKPAPLSWREKRWQRRRRRRIGEEALAWILVPVIVLGCWWLLDTVLGAMGTSPSAVIEQGKQALQMLDKSRVR